MKLKAQSSKLQRNTKLKAQSSKFQRNAKLQAPTNKPENVGAWDLGLLLSFGLGALSFLHGLRYAQRGRL